MQRKLSMNRLNSRQKEAVSQFVAITGAAQETALHCLQAAGWSIEGGIEIFYSSGLAAAAPAAVSGVDRQAIEALFLCYKDPDSELILADGVGSFCDDLGVAPEDIVMLVISYHLKAATMGEFRREEFVEGMVELRCDSLDALRAKLPDLRLELRNEDKFKEIYHYAYLFSREKGQKCVHLDTALGMWRLLFEQREWPWIDEWCLFLQQHHKHAISQDLWVQLLQFSKSMEGNFSNFDVHGAWPYLIDDFVERIREKQKGGDSPGTAIEL